MDLSAIAKQLLFNTVRMSCEGSDGAWSGTGFIYDAVIRGDGTASMPMLVTNRHVVEGAERGSIHLMRGENGEPVLGGSASVSPNDFDTAFTFHPNAAVDVAVAPLAGLLNQVEAGGHTPFFRAPNRELCLEPAEFAALDALEDITFVGYPNGLYDRVHHTPILRRGTTATPIELDYDGDPCFIVDASVFPGSSGSPVYLLDKGVYTQGDDVVVGNRVALLGVIAAVMYSVDHGRVVTATDPTVEFDQLLDLGIVYKMSAIEQVIDLVVSNRGWSRTPASI